MSAGPGDWNMDAFASEANRRKRKLTALPLLVVLFVISYLLLTKLVIEQDKTIDSQRSLIHTLFKDNVYLSTLHRHAGASSKKSRGDNQLQTGNLASQNPTHENQSNPMSLTQVPTAQVPAREVPSSQVPASKVGPTANAKNDHKTRKAEKSRPVPPVELTDPSDMRRVSFSI
jgi:hypothetical protein